MEECLTPVPQAMARTSAVYRRYQDWCADNGYHAENTRNFKALLAQRASVERRRPEMGGMTTVLIGYRLQDKSSSSIA